MEMVEDFVRFVPKKDYQANCRRRCNCGGHFKPFENQKKPDELECFCTTCHKMKTFYDTGIDPKTL